MKKKNINVVEEKKALLGDEESNVMDTVTRPLPPPATHLPDPNEKVEFRCLRHNSVYHDVFLSYRVNTEKKLADKVALLLDTCLTERGSKVRTFLDSNCLQDGGNWEKNFLSALHHAKLIVLLISKAGLDLASASHPNKTKIQVADRQQDNCLLEYEYALRLHEKRKASLFILAVGHEETVGGVKCKVRFPNSPEDIRQRLAMYSDTGYHQHRDDTRGPLISETMSKLLNLMTESKKGITFAHIDPDDPVSRVSVILEKLEDTEEGYPLGKKLKMIVKDVAYLRMKSLGFFCGMLLPFVSFLFVLTTRSPRQEAFRMGIAAGHGFDALLGAAYLLYLSFLPGPAECSNFQRCEASAAQLARDNPLLFRFCNCTVADITIPKCSTCFCSNYTFTCEFQEDNQRAFLFLGLIALGLSCVIFGLAHHLGKKIGTGKKDKYQTP